jgi:TRAP-type C4-dicarboxylate transport system permease large subunit
VKELGPFFAAGVAVLVIITVWPQTVLWLPGVLLAP